MSIIFHLPSLGENVESGDLVKLLVRPGDSVAAGQPLLEIETGKATIEVPSPHAGRIGRMLVEPGSKVSVGQPIFEWADSDTPQSGDAERQQPERTGPETSAVERLAGRSNQEVVGKTPPAGGELFPNVDRSDPPGTFVLPPLGENVAQGTIVKLLVEPGASVREGQPLLEIETGKATVEVPSPQDGQVAEWLVRAGETVVVGGAVLRWGRAVGSSEAGSKSARVPHSPPRAAAAPPSDAVEAAPTALAPEPTIEPPSAPKSLLAVAKVPAAPSVRRFAREIGVDITAVQGSGRGGRITIEDVKRHARQINTGRAVRTHCALEAEPLPDFTKWGPIERESMSTIRTITAEHLSRAWATIPHVTQHEKADITELEALRKRFAPRAEAAGGRLTLTAILLKIVAAALKVYPKFNASVDMPGRAIVYKKYVHLGVAVDTPRGLLVPVVRDVDRKNILQISVELTSLAQRAREGKLTPDELQGGTFTVTNLGAIGGSFFTPIINAPEVAILGVGRSAIENVWSGPENVSRPRLLLPLSLSYDHRLIDGADGARFLRWIVEAVEEPMLISLEG